MPPANTPSRGSRGGRRMMSGSLFSMPSASAGKQSVMRFIQSRCTGSSIVKPMSVAEEYGKHFGEVGGEENCIALRMFA